MPFDLLFRNAKPESIRHQLERRAKTPFNLTVTSRELTHTCYIVSHTRYGCTRTDDLHSDRPSASHFRRHAHKHQYNPTRCRGHTIIAANQKRPARTEEPKQLPSSFRYDIMLYSGTKSLSLPYTPILYLCLYKITYNAPLAAESDTHSQCAMPCHVSFVVCTKSGDRFA